MNKLVNARCWHPQDWMERPVLPITWMMLRLKSSPARLLSRPGLRKWWLVKKSGGLVDLH
jgi:hypothetical protein